jgi:hypothetical protein
MPDTKITALTALTAADPANDVLPIVDVSDTTMAASGTTKKISINNVLGCSGTATLASATITGDLTVDTSTLKVDSANNRVGINTASPTVDLEVGDGTGTRTIKISGATNVFDIGFGSLRGGSTYGDVRLWTDRFRIYNAAGTQIIKNISGTNGDETWYDGAGGTRMTLNSTGLGVGVTPSAWGSNYKSIDLVGGGRVFTVSGTGTHGLCFNGYNNNTNWLYQFSTVASRFELQQSGNFAWLTAPSGTAGNAITFTQAMTLDASGNLLVGTTSLNGSWNTKLTLSNDSGTTKWAVGPYLGGVANFLISAGASAGVYLNGTAATSWTSASDERLKDIIEPISNAIAKVGSLRAVIGKFKFDENNTRKPFLIAQDIQAVLPEAVDASNPDRLGVAYTDVIPLLVAAIKELTTRVQTLEAR